MQLCGIYMDAKVLIWYGTLTAYVDTIRLHGAFGDVARGLVSNGWPKWLRGLGARYDDARIAKWVSDHANICASLEEAAENTRQLS